MVPSRTVSSADYVLVHTTDMASACMSEELTLRMSEETLATGTVGVLADSWDYASAYALEQLWQLSVRTSVYTWDDATARV